MNEARKRAVFLLVLLAGCAPAEGPVYDLIPRIPTLYGPQEIRLRVDATAGTVTLTRTRFSVGNVLQGRTSERWEGCEVINAANWECLRFENTGPESLRAIPSETLRMSPGFELYYHMMNREPEHYQRRGALRRDLWRRWFWEYRYGDRMTDRPPLSLDSIEALTDPFRDVSRTPSPEGVTR